MALIDFFKVNQAPPDYVPTLQIGNDGHKQFIYDEFIKGHNPDFFYVPFHENAIDCCEIISSLHLTYKIGFEKTDFASPFFVKKVESLGDAGHKKTTNSL